MKVVLKQITKFGIIGVSAVLVDAFFYYLLSGFWTVDTSIAKGVGFLFGTIYTYFLNKTWTWKHTEKSNKGMLMKFAIVYAISFVVNIYVNAYFLEAINDGDIALSLVNSDNDRTLFSFKADKVIALFLATVASAIINFIGQKFFVFKKVKLDPKDETNIVVS